MDNKLLNHYSEELRYLSQQFGEFAATHPGIARELRLNAHHTEDPHIARMIQSFALISGQTKQLLNDNFSQLSCALLELLYPHYLVPFPSCSVVHFQPEKDLVKRKIVEVGHCIEIHSQTENQVCYFTTVYDMELLPIELTEAKLTTVSKETAHLFEKSHGRSVLNLVLETYDKALHFNQLDFKKLRFFIKAPKISAYRLYDLLFCHGLELVGYSGGKKLFQTPCNNCLKPVGFEKNEGMSPYSTRSSLGYTLLMEFFVFPEKFLFFDICFTEEMLQTLALNKIHLYIIFNKREEQLEPYVNKNYLSLHCSPIINLFKKTAEPIVFDYTRSEYQIIPDLDSTKKIEVYQLVNATLIDSENRLFECKPFFSINHNSHSNERNYYWQLHRRASEFNGQQNRTFLTLVDLALKKDSPVDAVLHLDLLCSNGNLPRLLTLSGRETHLQFQEVGIPIDRINILINLTAQTQIPLSQDTYWRLLSHLNLNHLSLFDNHAECEVLREVLHLYNFIDEENSRNLIDSIKDILCEKIVLRDPSGTLNAFIQGIKIKLIIDSKAIANNSLFLFGSILDLFFSLHCALNSFAQLELYDQQNKVLHAWPVRIGSKLIA
jgi:type VI secretion system protein ImpG